MTIKERMKLAILAKTRDRTRYVQLKEQTGISGDIWKNFWFDRREPDALMLEAISRAWPEFAYWLVTGATNLASGHICPPNAFCYEVGITPLITSEAFLRTGVDLAQTIEETVKANPDEEEDIYAVLHGFLEGRVIHTLPPKSALGIDGIFKKIQSLNQIEKVLSKEKEIHSQK